VEFLESGQDGLILRELLEDGREIEFLLGVDLGREVPELGSAEELPMEILTSMSVGTVSLQEILLAGLGLVVRVKMQLVLKFMLTMGKGAPITKLTSSLSLPVFTHLSLQFPGVILHESLLFLLSLESLLLRLNVYLEIAG